MHLFLHVSPVCILQFRIQNSLSLSRVLFFHLVFSDLDDFQTEASFFNLQKFPVQSMRDGSGFSPFTIRSYMTFHDCLLNLSDREVRPAIMEERLCKDLFIHSLFFFLSPNSGGGFISLPFFLSYLPFFFSSAFKFSMDALDPPCISPL